MVVLNAVRSGFYLDSVALMRIASAIRAMDGVEEAGLMIGTPANRQILEEAGVLSDAGAKAGPGDLVIALRADTATAAETAMAEARRLLDQPRIARGEASAWQPRTLRAGQQIMPDANLALISVPGDFAIAEARKAMRRGLDVMIFSDNIPISDEAELKREAHLAGRMVMGPDCGTAIIGGVPLAFANVVPRGDIGIIGASGTGIQEVSCLIAQSGCGITHAIGTGGRDLKAEVGAITTLMAIDAFDADAATRQVVLISKPPAPDVARAVLARIAESPKAYVVCFLGADGLTLPANARGARTLKAAAQLATGVSPALRTRIQAETPQRRAGARLIRGLFSGGTLCAEAQVVLMDLGLAVASNVPIPGALAIADRSDQHTVLDLGDDVFTRGRPHPMIEPAVRDEPLFEALADARVGVVLIDVVLGFGGHMDPAGHLAGLLIERATGGPAIVGSVTGTDGDPQRLTRQVELLEAAGVVIAPSNADAAALAASIVAG